MNSDNSQCHLNTMIELYIKFQIFMVEIIMLLNQLNASLFKNLNFKTSSNPNFNTSTKVIFYFEWLIQQFIIMKVEMITTLPTYCCNSKIMIIQQHWSFNKLCRRSPKYYTTWTVHKWYKSTTDGWFELLTKKSSKTQYK